MEILVTGGSGFQGSHIVEYLQREGHRVTILNTYSQRSARVVENMSTEPRVIWGSVTDKETVTKAIRDHDLIVHTAARIHVGESANDPESHLRVNILGTLNILEEIRRAAGPKPRLIFWSTCEVYGEPKNDIPLSEEAEFRPKSPYAASKAGADRLCFAYHTTYGTDVTIVRPFNIFGERQKTGASGALIPILVEKAMQKEPLSVSGTGEQSRDYMYISDLMAGLQIVLEHPELNGQAINLATGKDTSVLAIAQYLSNRLQAPITHTAARPGEVKRFPADITKAQKLGFEPKVSVWEGIDRYINWRLLQQS